MNFAQFCKQKSIKVIKIYIAELIKLVKQEKQKQLIDKLPTKLVKILNLTEKSFHYLINSDYIMEKAYKVFPNYFYYFLKENL